MSWGFTTASAELWLQSYAQIKGGRGKFTPRLIFVTRRAFYSAAVRLERIVF